MRTLKAAEGRWEEILWYFGLAFTNNRHIKCGFCEKKKMRITDRGWICVCGNGNHIGLIMGYTGMTFKDAACEVDRIINNEFKGERKPEAKNIMGMWKGLSTLRGTSGERYLNSRGIYDMPKRAMKFGRHYDVPSGKHYECITCVATDINCNPCYIHRTLLDGDKKADIDGSKKLEKINNSFGSVAIRLTEPDTCIGIAEGIETALSATKLYKTKAWATLNTSFMKKFIAPSGVKHLIIYADSDANGAGHVAAFECGNKNILSKNDIEKVTIMWPESGDFNDLLTKQQKVYEWILRR